MTDILTRAQILIRAVETRPEEELVAEMEALEAEASPDEQRMFPMLWEGLWGAIYRARADWE